MPGLTLPHLAENISAVARTHVALTAHDKNAHGNAANSRCAHSLTELKKKKRKTYLKN